MIGASDNGLTLVIRQLSDYYTARPATGRWTAGSFKADESPLPCQDWKGGAMSRRKGMNNGDTLLENCAKMSF